MRTITTNTDVYTFRELPPKAQEKAIDDVRNNEYYASWPWHEDTIYEFVKMLMDEGWELDVTDVAFSGFWSQGDGASFDATINIAKYINKHNLAEKYPLVLKYVDEFSIRGGTHKNSYATHYSHERTRYFEIETDYIDSAHGEEILGVDGIKALEAEIKALEKDIEDRRYHLSNDIYRALEKEYNDLMTDETITDYLIANDTEFTIDGEIY